MNGQNQKNMRTVVSLILSFILFMSICTAFLCLDLALGFCNRQNVVNSVNRSDYSENAYKQLSDKLDALMEEQRIPKAIGSDIVSEKRFFVDSGNCMKSVMKDKSEMVDTTEVEAALDENIRAYFKRQKIAMTSDLETALNETVSTAGQYYRDYASFKFGKYFVEYKGEILPAIRIIIPVCAVICIICVLLLWWMHKYRHRGLRYITYALIAAVSVNIVLGGILFIAEPFGIEDASEYYREFMSLFVRDSLIPCFMISALGLIGIVALLYAIRRGKTMVK